ncbi:hypothetical protein FPV67DRAFT_1501500 [Lyophyllum atratum]|nr:hypothetical protein FPV67DRAFT_1501500 [Lyophyllum atratum]
MELAPGDRVQHSLECMQLIGLVVPLSTGIQDGEGPGEWQFQLFSAACFVKHPPVRQNGAHMELTHEALSLAESGARVTAIFRGAAAYQGREGSGDVNSNCQCPLLHACNVSTPSCVPGWSILQVYGTESRSLSLVWSGARVEEMLWSATVYSGR